MVEDSIITNREGKTLDSLWKLKHDQLIEISGLTLKRPSFPVFLLFNDFLHATGRSEVAHDLHEIVDDLI